MKSSVSAIVLAAGKSSRMGSLKQLIKIGQETLLQRTLNVVSESRAGEIILVLGHRSDEIRATINSGEAAIVINDQYEQGMSTSIQAGLRNISAAASAALIVLADQPYLSSAVINKLIEEHEQSAAQILLPVHKGFRGNPVLIGCSLFPEMMQISGDVGCRSLFGLHSTMIKKVPVDDPGVLIDIDTEEDLKTFSSPLSQGGESFEDRFLGHSQHRVIVGQSDVAEVMIKLAKLMDFYVTVVAPHSVAGADHQINELDLSKANVREDSYIVVASKGKFDEEALQQAVQTDARYIALVGSKKRFAEMMQTNESVKRVRCPAGLEIHASTPAEIALSVLAEIINIKNQK